MARVFPEFVKNVAGGPPYLEPYPEAAGASFTRGAILTTNANGQVVEVSTSFDSILGVAAEPSSGVQNTKIKVWIATPIAIFAMSTAGSTSPAQSDVGMAYGVTKESGVWCVDKSDTTNSRVSIIGIDDRDPSGSANGRLWLVFSNAGRQIQF